MDGSRRGTLAPGEFRLRSDAACSAGRRSPAHLHRYKKRNSCSIRRTATGT